MSNIKNSIQARDELIAVNDQPTPNIFMEEGRFGFLFAPVCLVPPIFAYATVRHKVIPVSLVVRRGLRYLLAKNALRLILILPVAGIVWNIAANPNQTLNEIVLQNSSGFYLCFFLFAAVLLLNRFRLND